MATRRLGRRARSAGSGHCPTITAAHWRSIAHLRKARGLLVAKQYDAARTELDAIVARQDYPQVHRDEALSLAKEVSRLKQGLPARDPEATRLRLTLAPNPGRLIHVAPDAKPDGDGSEQRPFGKFGTSAGGQTGRPASRQVAPPCFWPRDAIRFPKESVSAKSIAARRMSPLVIRAAKPGTAVFYGGAVLKGFQPVEEPASAPAIARRGPRQGRADAISRRWASPITGPWRCAGSRRAIPRRRWNCLPMARRRPWPAGRTKDL